MATIIRYKKKQDTSSKKSRLVRLLKKQNKTLLIIEIVCIVASLLLVGFLALYWIGNGFSVNDNIVGINEGFYIGIDTPTPGSEFSQGNNIYIRGGSLGGTLTKAIVWDTQYNVGAPCNILGTQFSYAIFPNHISVGTHTIAVQAQNANGEWSQTAYTDFEVKSGGLIEPEFPSVPPATLPNLFQPLIDIWNGITMHTEQGTGDNDFNGDNVDDRLQTSPFAPRLNPFNLPITLIIIISIIILVIIIIALLLMRYYKQRNQYKSQMTRYIASSPGRRDWYLSLKRITANRQNKSDLTKKINVLKRRESFIKDKQQSAHTVKIPPRPMFYFRTLKTFGRNKKIRLAKLHEEEKRIKKAARMNAQHSLLKEQLQNVQRNLFIVNLENNKLALQNKLLELKNAKYLNNNNFRWFLRKISYIEAQQKQINDEYKRQLADGRERRAVERERCAGLLEDLNREKKNVAEQKAVRILIIPKENVSPQSSYIQNQEQNGEMTYGRSRKKKKARKVSY